MNLLEVVIPNADYFFIVLPDKKIPIQSYRDINISFSDRIEYKDSERRIQTSPVITYYVDMKKEHKEELKELFKDVPYSSSMTLSTKRAKISVALNKYIFDVDITARPDMGESWIKTTPTANKVKICLRLENTNISLTDRIEEAYEKYTSRFDLLDIRDD